MKRLAEYCPNERMKMLEMISRCWFSVVTEIRFAAAGESFSGTSQALVKDSGFEIVIKPGQSAIDEYRSWISGLAVIMNGMVEDKMAHDLFCHKLSHTCYSLNLTP